MLTSLTRSPPAQSEASEATYVIDVYSRKASFQNMVFGMRRSRLDLRIDHSMSFDSGIEVPVDS